jgi:hypothetical protein
MPHRALREAAPSSCSLVARNHGFVLAIALAALAPLRVRRCSGVRRVVRVGAVWRQYRRPALEACGDVVGRERGAHRRLPGSGLRRARPRVSVRCRASERVGCCWARCCARGLGASAARRLCVSMCVCIVRACPQWRGGSLAAAVGLPGSSRPGSTRAIPESLVVYSSESYARTPQLMLRAPSVAISAMLSAISPSTIYQTSE